MVLITRIGRLWSEMGSGGESYAVEYAGVLPSIKGMTCPISRKEMMVFRKRIGILGSEMRSGRELSIECSNRNRSWN
jgi:hypothetical protein